MRRYFITGTDTDCGKTYVTKELVSCIPKSTAIKPIASGSVFQDGYLINSDAMTLHKATGLPLEIINPWRFVSPVSPHIAAKHDGQSLDIDEIADYCMSFTSADKEVLFIEGAGGLYVPLTDEQTWVDLLKRTKIPVILVVGMTLGCINHALLTQEAFRSNHIECVGWVANCLDQNMLALDENIQTLERLLTFPLLATVPFDGACGCSMLISSL
jgi:dethiobiotin synthetase